MAAPPPRRPSGPSTPKPRSSDGSTGPPSLSLPSLTGSKGGLKLSIPAGNVPGSLLGQAGEGGWITPIASSSNLYPTPPPTRPSLSLQTPHSSSSSTSSGPSTSSRPKTPALSLCIPAPGKASVSEHSAYGMGGSLALPNREEEFDSNATAYYGGGSTPLATHYGTGGGGGGGYGGYGGGYSGENQRTEMSMADDLRIAVGQMRMRGSLSGAGSGSGNAGEHNHNGEGGGGPGSRRTSTDTERGQQSGSGSGSRSPANRSRSRASSSASSTSTNRGQTNHSQNNQGLVDPFTSFNELKESIQSASISGGSQVGGGGGAGGDDDDEGELDPRDYEPLGRLGEGAGGAVEKVRDRRNGRVMAMKVIPTSPNPAIHKQILRELLFLNSCHSPYITDHYGSFLSQNSSTISILMEYCEAGSLDALYRKILSRRGRTGEKVLAKISESMLKGLDYLHERKIIHRDIKPSNVLLTKSGQVKLCDFGVSGELVNSMAGTFTGTSFYMAPERIQGLPYSIKSDVWSLGLTLHEIAHHRFPFPAEGEPPIGGPIELLNYIVSEPVPRMIDAPAEGVNWTEGIQDFLSKCLIRSAKERPYPRDLLRHPWIQASERRNVNLAKWVAAIYEW